MEAAAPFRSQGRPAGDGALAAAAVQLVDAAAQDASRHPDAAVALVVRQGLAGLYLEGLTASGRRFQLPREAIARLQASARREAADDLVVARESEELLARLAALGPVILKGRALALAAWPHPALRPPGDLDLLLDGPGLCEAERRLAELGYRTAPSEPPLPLHASGTGVELLPPPGRHLAVDLHARPFRSVGARLDPERLLARSRPAPGLPPGAAGCRVLDDGDRLLYLAVHAAKHGMGRLKWLLDLHAVTRLADGAVWQQALRRARATGTGRPLWAALALLPGLPGAAVPDEVLAALRPPPPWPRVLGALVSRENAVAAPAPASAAADLLLGYALEVALEPSLAARSRRLLGVGIRLAARALSRCL